MTEGNGERIGLVLAGLRLQRKQDADHMLHLSLLRATTAHHGELNGFWAVLMHRNAALEPGAQNRAARLADLQCRGGVAGKDQLFNGHFVRGVLGDQHRDLIKDQSQSFRPRMLTDADATTCDTLTALAVGVDETITGISRAWIYAQDAVAESTLG